MIEWTLSTGMDISAPSKADGLNGSIVGNRLPVVFPPDAPAAFPPPFFGGWDAAAEEGTAPVVDVADRGTS
jgi:hypothetical protein